MPVYHFIYHAYRSWNADHPEGYYQHGEEGRHPPQPQLGKYRDRIAKQDRMEFFEKQQKALLEHVMDICGRRAWRVHAVGMDVTHVHVVVSWAQRWDPDEVKDRLKNLLSLLLNRREKRAGRRVFAKKAGDRRVRGMRHLNYLKREYLPGQGGVFWCED